jgi:hypothetical protein
MQKNVNIIERRIHEKILYEFNGRIEIEKSANDDAGRSIAKIMTSHQNS